MRLSCALLSGSLFVLFLQAKGQHSDSVYPLTEARPPRTALRAGSLQNSDMEDGKICHFLVAQTYGEKFCHCSRDTVDSFSVQCSDICGNCSTGMHVTETCTSLKHYSSRFVNTDQGLLQSQVHFTYNQTMRRRLQVAKFSWTKKSAVRVICQRQARVSHLLIAPI